MAFIPRDPYCKSSSPSWEAVKKDPTFAALIEALPAESREKVEAQVRSYVDMLSSGLASAANEKKSQGTTGEK